MIGVSIPSHYSAGSAKNSDTPSFNNNAIHQDQKNPAYCK